MKNIIWLLPFLLLASCDSLKVKHRSKAIAKVKDQVLYEDDLKKVIPKGTSADDSIFIRENFIVSWVKEQLLYRKALESLSSEQKDKDKEIEDYYRSLLKYDYERLYLSENKDSIVTDREVNSYYQENQKNFELKRNIIRLFYVKVPLDAPDITKLRIWLQRHNANDLVSLEKYTGKYAENYSLDTAIWFYFDDITKEVPLMVEHDPEHFIRHNKFVELKDENYLYLVHIIDNRIRDELSPLALEKEKIRQIILNKRKVKLIEELENRVYQEGLKQNLFEIHN